MVGLDLVDQALGEASRHSPYRTRLSRNVAENIWDKL